jgi:putative protease
VSIEILAPAGGFSQLTAAVRSGADAVYLGTGVLNARRNAENFDGERLREAASYCHGRGVRVYVTLNTLVKDSELPLVYREMESVADSGADAVIVQDLAVARMFRRHCPSMPIHASTQMGIHNLEGIRMAKELNIKRVVLARELTLPEIRGLCAQGGIELEVFVHGALCMCFSGSCYLSSVLGERSGNRGLCAQPCRLDFRVGNRGYALSLKDMSHILHIRELMDAGVTSLKIEGRMKRPEYVSAAVRACVEAVNGQTPDLTDLRAVFSRGGFTDGYLTGKRGPTMFGRRTKEDAEASKPVLGLLADAYRRERSRVPADMRLKLNAGSRSTLEVTDGVHRIAVNGDVPEPAITSKDSTERMKSSLFRTGGTPFTLRRLEVEGDSSLYLPQSKLNAMRKEALELLLRARSEIVPKQVIGTPEPISVYSGRKEPRIRVRLEKREQLSERFLEADAIYMPEHEVDAQLISTLHEKLICVLPRLTFPDGEAGLRQRLETLKKLGVRRVGAGDLGSVGLCARMGFDVCGDFGLNILNSESLLQYEALGLSEATLSFEINMSDARRLGGTIERGILGYGHLPLMLFRNCPGRSENGCGTCRGETELSDRTGARFKCLCSNREYVTLLNSVPLYLGDKELTGLDFVTLYFTFENASRCEEIWDAFIRGSALSGRHTRGLYFKKLK